MNIDELYDASMETLCNVWYEKGSASGNPAGFPLTINLATGITGSNELQIGFTGMETWLAAQMIQYGREIKNADMVKKAERILDFWTGNTAYPANSALPITWYVPNENRSFLAPNGEEYPSFLRMLTDGHERNYRGNQSKNGIGRIRSRQLDEGGGEGREILPRASK